MRTNASSPIIRLHLQEACTVNCEFPNSGVNKEILSYLTKKYFIHKLVFVLQKEKDTTLNFIGRFYNFVGFRIVLLFAHCQRDKQG